MTPDTAAEDTGRHLTTLPGWRQFAVGPPAPLPLLTAAEYAALPAPEKYLYYEARLDHHARLLVVATSTVRHTVATGRRLAVLNRHAISARRGLIVSGPAGTGKTIAITQLGLAHELIDRSRHPHAQDRIPVLYVTVPPAATARMLAAEFARFLGLPVRARFNTTDIIEAVVGVCTDARTGLVLVDHPFPYNREWKGLVAQMENTLLLHQHTPGSLTALDRYLHDRTGGMTGALSHLIRGAAIDAMLTGTEKITRDGLEAVPLDFAAQATTRKPRAAR